MLVKHRPIPVRFFGVRDVVAPLGFWVPHLLVGDVEFGVVFEPVDPAIAYTVAELLLLAPKNVVWEIWLRVRFVSGVEGFAKNVLLDPIFGN